MAKTQPRQPRQVQPTPPPRSSQAHRPEGSKRGATNARGGADRSRWIVVLGVAVAVIAGILAWRAFPAIGGNPAGARPIAAITAPDFHSLLIDPTNPDHIFFGSHAGIQESRDGGLTWQAGALQNADAMSMSVSPEEPSTLYVAGHDVFLASRDGGETWQPVDHDLPGTDLHAFAQDPLDPRRLYTLVVGAGLFSSTDGGSRWAPLATQPPDLAGHGALATDGATLYAVTSAGLVRSTDDGTSWEPTPAQPNGMLISLVTPAAAPGTLYAGTDSGVAKSTDGGASWDALGPSDVPVLALAIAPSDPQRVLIVDDTGAVYRSDDGGGSWTPQ